MPRIPGIKRYFRPEVKGPSIEEDVDTELAFHFEMKMRDLRARGLSPEAARHEALRQFGDLELVRERLSAIDRERRGQERRAEVWGALAQDVRYATRGLRKTPWFTAVVVLTLGLGIGANAVMFAIVDRLLLRAPAHVRDADAVRRLYFRRTATTGVQYGDNFWYAGFAALRDRVPSFADAAAHFAYDVTFGSGRDARQVRASYVTGNYFRLLGAGAALGRMLGSDDDRGPSGVPVAVLGHAFWQQQFGGERGVLGRRIDVNGGRYTVVGVAPRGFTGGELGAIDVWVPVSAGAGQFLNYPEWRTGSNIYWLRIIARLAPGAGDERATAEATTVFRQLQTEAERREDPTAGPVLGSIIPARGPRESSEATVSTWLAAVSVIVLIVACANVSNLLLARAVARRREIAVRLALGVGRRRLVGQLLVESILLAALGGAAALIVARWGGEIVRTFLLPQLASDEALLDVRVLGVTALAALVTGLVTGLVPAAHATRPDLTASLKAGSREGTLSRSRLRTGLLIVQAALSVVLLVGAGLFVRSLLNVTSQDIGFDADRVLAAEVDLSSVGYTREQSTQFYGRALERVAAMPGVERASLAVTTPFYTSFSTDLSVPGRDSLPAYSDGGPFINAVTPEYFATLGLTIVRGRGFTSADRPGAPRATIVNETMARLLWPGENPLGKCLRIGGDSLPCSEVVGVVEDARRDDVHRRVSLLYYVPLDAGVWKDPGMRALFVRVRGDIDASATAVRHELQSMDARLPYANVRSLQQLIDPQIQPWRLGATMFGIFGLLALTLAAVGLYGVIAYGVSRRAHEMGVRVALGARSADVVRLVVGEGMRVAMVGVAVGTAIALLAAPAIAASLFDVRPRDPLVLTVVVGVLLVVSVLASLLPAWRASRVDPIVALRSD